LRLPVLLHLVAVVLLVLVRLLVLLPAFRWVPGCEVCRRPRRLRVV
jgi:hypothetical protein